MGKAVSLSGSKADPYRRPKIDFSLYLANNFRFWLPYSRFGQKQSKIGLYKMGELTRRAVLTPDLKALHRYILRDLLRVPVESVNPFVHFYERS